MPHLNKDNKFFFELYFIYDTIKHASTKEKIIMAKKGDRINIILKCTECGNETYISSKNKKNDADRLELNKYCPNCKKATVHKERKK